MTALVKSPRWTVHARALYWRTLMRFGMLWLRFHRPTPPRPSFVKSIPATISHRVGDIRLFFYTPRGYRAGTTRRYPVVVNFHGGGFTIGSATDDASWVKVVLETLEAVVVSVDYRLAPVYPFPTAVDDGADAILYLVRQAEEFGIDPASIVLTGFSSGGNLAFTVPLKLEELKQEEVLQEDNGSLSADAWQSISSQPLNKPLIQTPSYNITAVVSWYPSTDYTITRSQRRSTCARPELTLSATFAELFDTAYLYPPGGDLHHPYLSPGVAPNEILAALPDNLIIYTCEWDMLQDEAYRFGQRLKDLGKKVQLCMIENVQHAWDKKPRLRPDAAVELLYREACFQLKQILENIHG